MGDIDNSDSIELAIFTVPGMVAFEGQHHLLHIFEARLRRMIEYCVAKRALLGLALPLDQQKHPGSMGLEPKGISKGYSPFQEMMGAGPVNIIKSLDDGRLLIAVSIKHRVRVVEKLQSVPFVIAKAELVPSAVQNQALADHTFERLAQVSQNILGDKFIHFEKRVPAVIWERKDLQGLLVRVMEWFRLEGHELQKLLEESVIEVRAGLFIEVMELYYNQVEEQRQQKATDQVEEKQPPVDPILPREANEDEESEGENVIKVNFGRAR